MARMTITLVLQGEAPELENMKTKIIRLASRFLIDCVATITKKRKAEYNVIIDV